jgi:hypothetical protein
MKVSHDIKGDLREAGRGMDVAAYRFQLWAFTLAVLDRRVLLS